MRKTEQTHVLDDRPVYNRIERAIAAGEMEVGTDFDIPAFLNNLKAAPREGPEGERWPAVFEVDARLVDGRLVLSAPSDSPLTVRHNRVVFDDGRELVITLRQGT